jgi:hypothetical protein
MKKYINIRRFDTDINHTHAWLVQVQRQGEISIKMFSDRLYGGKQKALKAAIEFRDNTLATISNYKYHYQRRSILRRNNTSGIPGVGHYENISNPKTKNVAIFWAAFWDDEFGVRRQRKFSVLRYGERKAKKLAIAEREKRLKEVCAAKCKINYNKIAKADRYAPA